MGRVARRVVEWGEQSSVRSIPIFYLILMIFFIYFKVSSRRGIVSFI